MRCFSEKLLLISLFILLGGGFSCLGQSEKEKINNLIDKKIDFNKNNKNSFVFKIQLFNGNETEALEIKKNFEQEFPEFKTILLYRAPEWKTQVGLFKTRLEADRALLKISEKFAGAIVLVDKV
jgi:hypothetical protein